MKKYQVIIDGYKFKFNIWLRTSIITNELIDERLNKYYRNYVINKGMQKAVYSGRYNTIEIN